MKYLLSCFILLLVVSCSDRDTDKDTVFDEQLKTMDKARNAEQILLDNAARQKEQIEINLAE
jgi:hypothetical protein